MVKCRVCPKRLLAKEMSYFMEVEGKKMYTCSNKCYKIYVEEWRKNEE